MAKATYAKDMLIVNCTYEKGNLEIHSSDYCKHSDCDSDHSRRDLLYGDIASCK